jgi:membrane-associated phospholipid phosphatase
MFLGSYDILISKLVLGFLTSLPLWAQTAFVAVARHGDKLFLLMAFIGLMIMLFRETNYRGHLLKTLHQVIVAVVGSVMGWFAVVVIKDIIAEPRPFQNGVIDALWQTAGHAFPSGHAAVLLMVSLSLRGLVNRWLSNTLLVIAIVVPLFRFAVGVHSIMDVLVGWMIGVLFAMLITHQEDK